MQREANRKRTHRLGLVIGIIFGLLAILAIAGTAVYNSSLFSITEVRVDGAQRLTADHLTQLAAVPAGSTLLRVDTGGIVDRLESDPWVQSASVSREFPSTLVLSITERTILANVEILPDNASDPTTHWLVSTDGIWLGSSDDVSQLPADVTADEVSKLPQINNLTRGIQPIVGDAPDDVGLENAISILNGFSSDMYSMVASISAPDAIQTTLTLTNNVSVAFGSADDIQAKEEAITTILNEHPGKVIYINVRVADRATYKASS
jgi:cell division protein FtsQ